MRRLAPLLALTAALASSTALADEPPAERTAPLDPPDPTAAQVDELGEDDGAANVERYRRRTRWFGGIAIASAGAALVGYVALAFQPEYPRFETFAAIGGVGTSLGLIFFGAWKAAHYELRSAERALRGEAVRAERRTRRQRLLRTGWPMAALGLSLVAAGMATIGAKDTPLARPVLLGGIGGGIALVGLATAIRGHALRVGSTLAVTIGPGSLGLTGTF